jgi:hypothetical protein
VIKRSINKKSGITFCFVFAINLLSAQIVSPFNKRGVSDTLSNYSFIVSGHFHGASSNISTFPASSLQANIDTLNSLKPSFLMSLGDMFLDVNAAYLDHYQKSLFSKLKMPLFNAVGNHDLANGNMYEKVYGITYFSFKVRSEFYIVLNTEIDDGSITDEQLKFFKNEMTAASLAETKNIFIFSHRPVWAENNKRYKQLFPGNTRTAIGSNNFENAIKPVLSELAKTKNVFWMSGSMGGGPASFFYDKEPLSNITFIQTAIRDLPRDAVLLVNISNGKVSLSGISLTGETLEPIENYNIDYWSTASAPEEKFNYRLLPYLTKQMLMHYYFWIGFFSALSIILLSLFIKRRWRKNK